MQDISGDKKDPTSWRLRYAELDGVPLNEPLAQQGQELRSSGRCVVVQESLTSNRPRSAAFRRACARR